MLKNNERRLAALVAAIIALSAISSVVFVSASAPTNTGIPAFLQTWYTAHPTYQGCLKGSVTAETVEEVSCMTNLSPVGTLNIPSAAASGSAQPRTSWRPSTKDSSWGPTTVDCSITCWGGGEFYAYGPYSETNAYPIPIPSNPSNLPSKFSGWTGLTNCTWSNCPVSGSTYLLVQSGFQLTSPKTSGYSMFVELYGNFYLNGSYCATSYCGYKQAESVGDDLQAQQIYVTSSSNWEAFVADQSVSGYPYITVTGGPSLGGSLPYAIASLEAGGASSNSYITTPVDINNFGVANSAFQQVNLDTNVMLNYVGPTASSGVTLSYSATGSTYGTISIT